MTKQEIIDLVDKYTGICDIIFSEELADALIPIIEQEKKDTLKEFVEWLKEQNASYDEKLGLNMVCMDTSQLDDMLKYFIKEREK